MLTSNLDINVDFENCEQVLTNGQDPEQAVAHTPGITLLCDAASSGYVRNLLLVSFTI